MQHESQKTTRYNIPRGNLSKRELVIFTVWQDYYLDSIVIIITFKIIIILYSWQETIRKDFISRSRDLRV